MPHFTSRPVTVEARQLLTTGDIYSITQWMQDNSGSFAVLKTNEPSIMIYTLEGAMQASVGDWIIRGTQGEFYPCKNIVFEEKYELAEEL